MDNETDTEHEPMQEREIGEQIAQYEEMNPLIRQRMVNLAQLLAAKEVKQEEGTKKLERLEELLLNFQETEIPIE
jgi:oligoendopeptidase F